MKKSDYFTRVYEVVAQIPYGKVTTYGAIASFLGIRSGARLVGWALNQTLYHPKGSQLPCHRVVNRNGELTGSVYFGGKLMSDLLIQEGVSINQNGIVDFKNHFWNPVEHLKN